MKRFLALLLVSTLAFAFSSKAQSPFLKKGTIPALTLIDISDGLSAGELTSITTISTYSGSAFTSPSGTTLPTSDAAPCNGSKYVCSLYILLPNGNTSTDQQILDAIKTKLTTLGWPGCGTSFTFDIAGGTNNASAVFFCKGS